MKRFLVDTCVWMDFYENRKNKFGKNIGCYAYEFIVKCAKKNFSVYMSKITVGELKTKFCEEEIETILRYLQLILNLKITEVEKSEFLKAKELANNRKIPNADCILAIQARNNDFVVVTRDKHFFNDLKDVCDSIRPEDVS